MEIRELYLKNFGKFSEQKFFIKEGVNIIYGENEFGKTTIHTFIKGMLFGIERIRGRGAKNDTFSKYEPWENANYYSGVIRFSCGNRMFCLERTFDKYSKKANLICEDDGEVLSVEAGDLEMLLEGMTASTFENTVSIGQLQVETNQNMAVALKDYATNYYSAGNSEIHLQAALEMLKTKKKVTETSMKQRLLKRQMKREKMEFESSFVLKDLQKMQAEIIRIQAEIASAERENNKNSTKSDKLEVKQGRNWRIHPITYLFMIIVVLAPVFFLHRPWNYLWPIVIASAEGLFIWNRLKDGKRKYEKTEEQDVLKETIKRLYWQKEQLGEDIKEKEIIYSNLQENLQELDELDDTYKELDKHRRALELSMSQLTNIGHQMNKDFGGTLNQKASTILAAITAGKYTKLVIDEELQMSIYKGNKSICLEQVSRGTLEQIYFCLRMAIIELLFKEEFPVILDDTFVFYDDQRLKNVLEWLVRSKKQVLLFTCQKREAELLKKMGA